MASPPNILDVLSLALFYGFDKETENAFRELDLTTRSFQEFDLNGYFTRGKQYLYLYNNSNPESENVLKQLLARLFEKGLEHVFVLRGNTCFLLDLRLLERQQPIQLDTWFHFSTYISF